MAVARAAENCLLLSADDKAKVSLGEPGLAISTGVRGKRSIVPQNITLAALDHDVQQKGSITPSVLLDISIPEYIEDSFYRGRVTIALKDAVFEPSSPNRFAAEVCNYWDALSDERKSKISTLLMFTDRWWP